MFRGEDMRKDRFDIYKKGRDEGQKIFWDIYRNGDEALSRFQQPEKWHCWSVELFSLMFSCKLNL